MSRSGPAAASRRIIGTWARRADGIAKVTGQARFADDVHLPNMLHGKVLRSPHAHARLVSVQTAKAADLPGVRGVVTAANFPLIEHRLTSQGEAGSADIRDIADNCMARDRVLYDGHAVAAVAADNAHIAEEALELIEVEYELLQPILDLRAAMAKDAPPIHEHFFPGAFIAPTEACLPNASRLQQGAGDVDRGFAEAHCTVDQQFLCATVHQGYIEGHIVTADWSADGLLTVWTSTQGQFEIRDTLADVLELPRAMIRVIPLEVGGAFGGKERIYADPVAALLSRVSGRPVKIAMSRAEVLRATGPSPGSHIKARIGATADGRLTAARLEMAYEAGAFAGGPMFLGVMAATTRYNIPNLRIDGFDVIVNKPKTRPYRAPGGPQALFAVEQLIDDLARRLKLDPVELRLRNLTRSGDRLFTGLPCPEIDTAAILEAARAHPHYTTPLTGPHQGRGFAYGFKFNIGTTSSVRLSVNSDGSIYLSTGGPDMSGSNTTLAMQAAEALGVDLHRIRSSVGDTESLAFSRPTIGSRTTYATGKLVFEASEQLLARMAERAALLWEAPADSVRYHDGCFRTGQDSSRRLGFDELAARLDETGGPISVAVDRAVEGMIPQTAAHLVDVEVDIDTGKVDILRYTVFQDVGKAIHPGYVEGQMQGSVAQGIGLALTEEYIYDQDGHLRNANLLDYRMPTALDVPEIETVILESPNPAHPYGVRGCGEVSIMPPAAAIANAIHDATGVRMLHLPMAPHRVLAALRAGGVTGG